MDKVQFLEILRNPEKISYEQAESLEESLQQYPYFQLGYALVAKYQHEQKSMLASQKIRRAALYAYSRAALKHLLEGSTKDTQTAQLGSLLDNVKQELEDFDKKMANASYEDFDQELSNITATYKPVQDYSLENEQTESYEKSETQKHQDEVIDSFLNSDFSFKTTETPEENFDTPIEDIIVSDNTSPVYTETSSETDNNSNFFDNLFEEASPKAEETSIENTDTSNFSWENKETETDSSSNFFDNALEESSKPTEEPIFSFENHTDESSEEVREIDAIILYNEGKIKEALEVYQKLLAMHPDKKDYYESQIYIFSSDLDAQKSQEEEEKTAPRVKKKEEIKPEVYVEKAPIILSEPEEEKAPAVENLDLSNKAELTEADAMSFFHAGRIQEAIEIYKKLMLQYPEKKAYFAAQIEILES
jgi:tetratricopeptide (TPR) repeat protein